MSRRGIPDPAMQLTMPLVIGAFALAGGAMQAHQAGLAAMRAAREEAASHALRAQLDQAIEYAQLLGQHAAEIAAENERLKAENSRMKALARQHYDTLQAVLAH